MEILSTKELIKPYFLTGAGISLESGIPTFRGNDKDAVWKKTDVSTGTLSFFRKNPVESWKIYLDRFSKINAAKPSTSHILMAQIESKVEDITIVTQNIDGLHLAAGSTKVYEVHGASRYFRCSKYGCEHGAPRGLIHYNDVDFSSFIANPSLESIPRCLSCDSIIRPHVLWFDESYEGHHAYMMQEAIDRLESASVIVALGTSLQVSIAERIEEWKDYLGIRMILVDPFIDPSMVPKGVELVQSTANDFLKSNYKLD
jgi:NAD-dependent SIR2 family protein deacetylase